MGKHLVIQTHEFSKTLHSIVGTSTRILRTYYFSRAQRYVCRCMSMCVPYAMFKAPRGQTPGLFHPIKSEKRSFDTVHVYLLLGPFVILNRSISYIFELVDDLKMFVKISEFGMFLRLIRAYEVYYQ